MNTPQQQAELYRKAAETIEMCAKHGIEAKFKYYSVEAFLISPAFDSPLEFYEFPIAVIEGQLVWADTVVYNALGRAITARHMKVGFDYTLVEPKQSLCEVEGKPVYKGDKLWNIRCDFSFVVDISDESGVWGESSCGIRIGAGFRDCSWNPPKRTVMVEIEIDDAEYHAGTRCVLRSNIDDINERTLQACRKAIDNLKGE